MCRSDIYVQWVRHTSDLTRHRHLVFARDVLSLAINGED